MEKPKDKGAAAIDNIVKSNNLYTYIARILDKVITS